MLRPKRRHGLMKSTHAGVEHSRVHVIGKPADDPHHLIGHGRGGMATKRMTSLCLCEASTSCMRIPWHLKKYGSQLRAGVRFIDRALANWRADPDFRRKVMRDIQMVLDRLGNGRRVMDSGVDYSPIAAGFKGFFPIQAKHVRLVQIVIRNYY